MRVGLVFAGGFAKGAYHVGAIRALEQYIPRRDICCISASSIGVLNAYAYATDNLAGLERLWREAVEEGERRIITKFLSGNALQRNISLLAKRNKPLAQPLYCALLDWRSSTLVYKDLSEVSNEDLRRYMRASVALPPYSTPISVGDVSYYDGGLVDNIPVAPLMDTELDYVICFYFDETNYQFENEYFDDRIIKVSFTSNSMLSHSFVLTSAKIDEMIKVGYDVTKKKLNEVFANGIDDLDFIYNNIETNNRKITKPNRRLTVDVVISNLNRVTQKLTKRQKLHKED